MQVVTSKEVPENGARVAVCVFLGLSAWVHRDFSENLGLFYMVALSLPSAASSCFGEKFVELS